MRQVRQGDIYLIPITILNTKKLKQIGEKNYTLAMGEISGHGHIVHGDVKIFSNNIKGRNPQSQILIQVGDGKASLKHEFTDGIWTKEHFPIEIEPGIYEVVRQRELSLLDGIRQVQD